jgi:integrase
VLTFLYTGWQSSELLRMRWGDLRRSRVQAGVTIYAWQGKGNRRADDVLPAHCFQAICAYLRVAGRLRAGLEPAMDEPIWLPVCSPRVEHLRHAPSLDSTRPITERSALRILRSALRGAQIPQWQSYRMPDLRHTHAHLLLEGGQPVDVVQKRLHHVSAATTNLYIRAVHAPEPIDMVSDTFAYLLA